MKKSILFFLFIISSAYSWGYDFTVDGMNYTITNALDYTCGVAGASGTCPETVEIPETVVNPNNGKTYTVTSIEKGAFTQKNLISIKLPFSITTINSSAFWNCSKLKHISLPNIQKINDGAFYNCSALEYIIVGKNLQKVNDYPTANSVSAFTGISASCEIFNLSNKTIRADCAVYTKSNCVQFKEATYTYNGTTPQLEFINKLQGYEMTATPSNGLQSDAGTWNATYNITFKDSRLEATFEDIPCTYTINKAPLSVSMNNKQREYGEENPTFDYTVTGLVGTDTANDINIQASTTANKRTSVGTYSISAETNAKNYDVTVNEATLTITKAPLIVKINDATREYGSENPSWEYRYDGLKNNETTLNTTENFIVQTEARINSPVGDYPITISGGKAQNYDITKYINGTLHISKASLTVTPNNTSRKYGEENPIFDCRITGYKAGDTYETAFNTTPTVSTPATKYSNVGSYTLTATSGDCNNYNISYQTGYLTIEKATLFVKPDNTSREYGEANPAFTYTCTGFANEENEDIIIVKPAFTTNALQTSNVGTYNIQVQGADAVNYTFEYQNGTLEITKAPLSVKVNDATRIYGEENPGFSMEYTGFKNSDTSDDLNSIPTIMTSATKTSDVGTYDIIASGGNDNNYNFTEYANGTLTIEKADQDIIWELEEKNYNIGAQIELTAVATSGLDVTYTIDNENCASIYQAGRRIYLNCIKDGFVNITAQQLGDKNHFESPFAIKRISIGDATPIHNIIADKDCNIEYYSIDGRKTSRTRKGINIIRGKDGKSKKVLMK